MSKLIKDYMNKPVSEMTTEELKDLESDIRNRKLKLEHESKKIIWTVASNWFNEAAFPEGEYCLVMERVKQIAEDAKDRFLRNIKEDVPTDLRRTFDFNNIPIIKRLIVSESEYGRYFKK